MQGRRNILAHAVENHGADERGRSRKNGELVERDVGIGAVVRGESFVPGGAVLATLVREAENEDQKLLAARPGENDFGIVEGFGFDSGNRLGENRRGKAEHREAESDGKPKVFHRCSFAWIGRDPSDAKQ